MKKLLSFILAASAFMAVAQPKKAPKMAPVLAPGYYVGAKNDTTWRDIQTNPNDETDFYKGFGFRPAKGGKVVAISIKKAKAYGFEGRHFVQSVYDGQDVYLER